MTSTMQLEFSQAMSDFKTMFPEMDCDVIEAVLRANQGAVDATIDQLLAMSVDNQNERLRNQLDENDDSPSKTQQITLLDKNNPSLLLYKNEPKNQTLINTGASPKTRNTIIDTDANSFTGSTTTINSFLQSTPIKVSKQKKWNPPLLGPLPPSFLRLSNVEINRDYDLPDEQFALMLQNEEFMNELRWNQEFMNELEKEQHEKGRTEDDAAFKERLKHMGKISRKKFLQMARVFTWQKNKKSHSARHLESLPLKEEPSDDEDVDLKKK